VNTIGPATCFYQHMKIRNQAVLCRAVLDFEPKIMLGMLFIITINVKSLCDHKFVLW